MLCYSVFAVILMACLFNSGDAAAPSFASASFAVCAVTGKAVGETVATFSATDTDGDAITYSIAAAGNTGTDFVVSGANLNVANALDSGRTAAYTLVVTATDANSDTGTANYVISVQSTCSGASALAASLTALLIGLVYILN